MVGALVVGDQYVARRAPLKIVESPPPMAARFGGIESAPATVSPSRVIVHVKGAVKQPGVYEFGPDDRVRDAIARAGGAKPGAFPDELNLAAKLVDGEEIIVPSVRSATPAPAGARRTPTARRPGQMQGFIPPLTVEPFGGETSKPGSPAPSGGIVSLNRANQQALEGLPGIGPATAKKILDYRAEHGGFSSVDELLAVRGIGPKKLEQIRPYVRL